MRSVRLFVEQRNRGAIGVFSWHVVGVDVPNAAGLEGEALWERAADTYRETHPELEVNVAVVATKRTILRVLGSNGPYRVGRSVFDVLAD